MKKCRNMPVGGKVIFMTICLSLLYTCLQSLIHPTVFLQSKLIFLNSHLLMSSFILLLLSAFLKYLKIFDFKYLEGSTLFQVSMPK